MRENVCSHLNSVRDPAKQIRNNDELTKAAAR